MIQHEVLLKMNHPTMIILFPSLLKKAHRQILLKIPSPPAPFNTAQIADKTAYSLAADTQTDRGEERRKRKKNPCPKKQNKTMNALDLHQFLDVLELCQATTLEKPLGHFSYVQSK